MSANLYKEYKVGFLQMKIEIILLSSDEILLLQMIPLFIINKYIF